MDRAQDAVSYCQERQRLNPDFKMPLVRCLHCTKWVEKTDADKIGVDPDNGEEFHICHPCLPAWEELIRADEDAVDYI